MKRKHLFPNSFSQSARDGPVGVTSPLLNKYRDDLFGQPQVTWARNRGLVFPSKIVGIAPKEEGRDTGPADHRRVTQRHTETNQQVVNWETGRCWLLITVISWEPEGP